MGQPRNQKENLKIKGGKCKIKTEWFKSLQKQFYNRSLQQYSPISRNKEKKPQTI